MVITLAVLFLWCVIFVFYFLLFCRERGYKSHTAEKTFLDKVIESVKQEQTTFKPIDPDAENEDTKE